eukprot:2073900-Rhodomonas_salina.1
MTTCSNIASPLDEQTRRACTTFESSSTVKRSTRAEVEAEKEIPNILPPRQKNFSSSEDQADDDLASIKVSQRAFRQYFPSVADGMKSSRASKCSSRSSSTGSERA